MANSTRPHARDPPKHAATTIQLVRTDVPYFVSSLDAKRLFLSMFLRQTCVQDCKPNAGQGEEIKEIHRLTVWWCSRLPGEG
jgi:hypothetical protein